MGTISPLAIRRTDGSPRPDRIRPLASRNASFVELALSLVGQGARFLATSVRSHRTQKTLRDVLLRQRRIPVHERAENDTAHRDCPTEHWRGQVLGDRP
ncbi:hypothetical protein [Streptomyces sp. NPDC058294]|uniref:hypothetical protein n=1 Tax=Streptomyces sp. NPDC058294 TaxID=3346430 RepID=UPI0036E781A7